MQVRQSDKLAGVAYDIRGPVLDEAKRLERAGRPVLKLNIGNPAAFGFEAPNGILRSVADGLPQAHGYGDARGLPAAREAVAGYYRRRGIDGVDAETVYLGNGVSELIMMALQALLNTGDEVLIPAPDYPLWTAVTSLAGGRPVHYRCDEAAAWSPDLADIAARITDRTRAIVVINPNNPTGAVYPPEVLTALTELARRHNLILFCDEIYDQIVYDDAVHHPTASFAPDLLCLTFGGMSKAYRVAGFRSGWMAVTGPLRDAASYLEGLDIMANLRLCPNVPAQYAVAAALTDDHSLEALLLPGGRLREQRDRAVKLLTALPGVSCVPPAGALYAFPRFDPAVHRIDDDEAFVLDLLRAEGVLLVQGTAFNWPHTDHVRIVTLPSVEDLEDAIGRLGRFLTTRSGQA